MSDENAIDQPIVNSPFDEPTQHWKITANEPPELVNQRRKATYYYSPPNAQANEDGIQSTVEVEVPQIDKIRKRLAEWRPLALRGEGGVTRVTAELLKHWRRKGRKEPLFFAQLEAAETVIFLTEARKDFLQGINIPSDEPGEEKKRNGFKAFSRLCCKMATGAGKTTVMAMLAAWSILNKTANKNDKRYSSAVLVVCPNVTIRERLAELNPSQGEASIYRTRDLLPPALMPQLEQGKVLVVNWHVFEPQSTGSAKVEKRGQRLRVSETVLIGDKTQTLRGKRYMTEKDLYRKELLKQLRIKPDTEKKDAQGNLRSVVIESEKYIETDAALVRRVLRSELGESGNLLVFNDEAHHAYRLRGQGDGDGADEDLLGDEGEAEYYYKEATVWVDGLDKVHLLRGINQCVDFSATPYFLGSVGDDTGRLFPWTVSNFGLHDAIEAGLVKIPQLAARDSSGNTVPGYFNIWKWLLPQLTTAERGGKKSEAKPAAVLKYAHTPIAMLGGMWETLRQEWAKTDDARPPVFIIVCKTTKLAQVIFDWLANDQPPSFNIPSAGLSELINDEEKGIINTVRIDSKVQHEIAGGYAKSDENRWMRYLLDTVGKTEWHKDGQGNNIYPTDFERLAKKMGRAQFLEYPPGRDIRCIVSVGMLTEGWDCNTVTHIIGLRPFMSQLLCEQVIGRGLRRAAYDTGDDGLMHEEIATVLGVPLSIYPVKKKEGDKRKKVTKYRIYAVPQKADEFKISFPRVEGYRQLIRDNIVCDVDSVPKVVIDIHNIPQEVEMAAGLPNNKGRIQLGTPGGVTKASLEDFRARMRLHKCMFEMTQALVKHYVDNDRYVAPVNILFSQLYSIINEYVNKRVSVASTESKIKDAFVSPYYGYIIEKLYNAIRADVAAGEAAELPRYEQMRPPGTTAEVDFYTRIEPYEIIKSHVNALVAHSKLEQQVAYALDQHAQVQAFVKNENLGFGIPYYHNETVKEYEPDFLIRLQNKEMLILEPKGYDPLKEEKKSAAERWTAAVNADGKHGRWHYKMIGESKETAAAIEGCCG